MKHTAKLGKRLEFLNKCSCSDINPKGAENFPSVIQDYFVKYLKGENFCSTNGQVSLRSFALSRITSSGKAESRINGEFKRVRRKTRAQINPVLSL
ncbi:hypothetical protein ABEW19_11190 [Paenibacillus illinoisensis]|uniref:hypothetical protein n=1 Tax=Paenibacillus illinoisensis TaxID=59845 RepID=UPI003D2E0B09